MKIFGHFWCLIRFFRENIANWRIKCFYVIHLGLNPSGMDEKKRTIKLNLPKDPIYYLHEGNSISYIAKE